LGLYKYFNHELTEALDQMNKTLEINKKYAPAYSLLGYIYSEYYYNYQEAIKISKKGVENIPHNIGLINNLAYNYLMNNDIDNAKVILEKVKNIVDHVYLIATRGLLKIKEGDLEEGRRLYNEAANMARSEYAKNQVMQKKYLEIAKYYLNINNNLLAQKNILKVLSIKNGNGVYMEQAVELRKK
jgi:Tfp pilus assembly protein PilF